MHTRFTVPTLLACCGLAAAQPQSFRGLGRPVSAEMGVGAGAVTDDGSLVVGGYQSQSHHPTIIDTTSVLWRSNGTIQILPAHAQGITPDGAYIYGTNETPPMITPTAWRYTLATGAIMYVPEPWTYSSWARGLTTDGQVLLCAVDQTTPSAALIRNGAVEQQIIAPSPFIFYPTSMSGDAGVIAGTLWSQSTQSVPAYWRGGQFTTFGPAGLHPERVLVSRDGTTFTGTYQSASGRRAFRATRSGSYGVLGLANYTQLYASCISGDGNVIGGTGFHGAEQRWRAYVWTRSAGTRDLKSVLIQMGVTAVVPWHLESVNGVSGDGSWIVGNGINPAGLSEPWIARIPPFCYANCDNTTAQPVLNVADFSCFLARFAANDPYANCDNSSSAPVLNVQDFTCFLQKFSAGCAP